MLGLVILFPLIALGLLGPSGSLKWINNYGVQILIYVMLGWGLNIVVGLAGLLDLGYVAFYAVEPIPMRCSRLLLACHSGSACRSPGF